MGSHCVPMGSLWVSMGSVRVSLWGLSGSQWVLFGSLWGLYGSLYGVSLWGLYGVPLWGPHAPLRIPPSPLTPPSRDLSFSPPHPPSRDAGDLVLLPGAAPHFRLSGAPRWLLAVPVVRPLLGGPELRLVPPPLGLRGPRSPPGGGDVRGGAGGAQVGAETRGVPGVRGEGGVRSVRCGTGGGGGARDGGGTWGESRGGGVT